MKRIFSTIVSWINAHRMKSMIIGIVSAIVLATAITLPIVLSKNKEPTTETPTETETDPLPPPPAPTRYTVSKEDTAGGTITLSESGEFDAGKQILVTAEASEGYTFKEIIINGEVASTSNSYTFEVSADLADTQNKIVVSATFEQDSPKPPEYADNATISGPTSVVEGETITLTAEPIPAGTEFQFYFTWSITEGNEYVTIVESTATTVTIRGEYGDHEATIKADDGNGIEVTITIAIEFGE